MDVERLEEYVNLYPNSPVIGDRIGHNDFIDKAIVGSFVHALRA
jgi:hypothetical protein